MSDIEAARGFLRSKGIYQTIPEVMTDFAAEQNRELVEKCAALATRLERAEEALEPFANFSRQWKRQPLSSIADEFYAIHTGTAYEAVLRVSDCHRAANYFKEDRG